MKITLRHPFILLCILVATHCAPPEKHAVEQNKLLDSAVVSLTPEQFKASNVQLGTIQMRSVSGVIKANGMLDVPPQNLVTISAPMGGFVKNTELLQGMKVTHGQVVVVLEHPDYIQLQQDYLESKSQLEFLELDYKRQQDLARENVNAAKSLQQSKSSYLSAQARVLGLTSKLKFLNINPTDVEKGLISNDIRLYAPIDGFITQVNVNIGMHVNAADVMFRIINTHHLHAEAQVFEKDITKLKIGQRVKLMLTNDERERTAKVYLIGKEITPERTVRVHCHLDQEDASLIPGMYFSAMIETDNKVVRTLPESAIVSFEGKDYIFLAQNEALRNYRMTEVRKGRTENGFVEIYTPDGFDDHFSIVITGAYELLSFLKNTGE